MTVHLRPYQETAIEGVREAFRAGHRAPLLVAATGAGKTVMFGFVAGEAARRGKRVLIVAHRRELIRQASAKLHDASIHHGIIAPGFTPNRLPVQVGSVQTLGRRLNAINPPDLIVVDEAHHAVAGQWASVLAAFPSARVLGVTATPERLDGRGLGTVAGGCFDAMVMGPQPAELIAAGFLTPTRVFAPATAPDLSGIRTVMGDYQVGALSDAMSRPTITGDAVAHYIKHAAGQAAILFSPSVAHAETMAAEFRAVGVRAIAASGTTPQAERDAAISGLATGAVQVLCSCDLISEGLDVPAVGCVILMRPTKSLGLYLQQVGRGLRPAPGKERLIVLDHAGNSLTHGMIDQPREWSLEGRPRKPKGEQLPPARQCPECFAVHDPAPECPECGFQYPAPKARELAHVEGELSEVAAPDFLKWRHQPLREVLATARDEDLPLIAKARGYKRGWVFHQRQARAALRGAA